MMELWETIEPYLINLFPVAIGIAAVFTWRRGKRARERWQIFAEKHGFEFTPPSPPSFFSKMAALAFQNPGVVSGELDGLPFRLCVEVRGASKSRRFFTIMSVEIPGIPAGLKIYHQNAFLQLTKLFGAQDVTTGYEDFDGAFVVKGNNPAEVLTWLDESRRSALLRVLGEHPNMDIREDRLEFQREKIIETDEVLEKALEGLRALVPYLNSQR